MICCPSFIPDQRERAEACQAKLLEKLLSGKGVTLLSFSNRMYKFCLMNSNRCRVYVMPVKYIETKVINDVLADKVITIYRNI